MVDEDISKMYDQVIAYISSKQMYYADPTAPDVEFSDHEKFDFTSAIDVIQCQIRNRPSMGEAATIKGYRDMRSATSEYDIRLTNRSQYWADAAVEEQDNIDKWDSNKTITFLHMNGKDAGQ